MRVLPTVIAVNRPLVETEALPLGSMLHETVSLGFGSVYHIN